MSSASGRRAVRSTLAGSNGLRDARWRVRRMRVRVLDESYGRIHSRPHLRRHRQGRSSRSTPDAGRRQTDHPYREPPPTDCDGWQRMREAVGLDGEGDAASMTTHVFADGEWGCRPSRSRLARGASVGGSLGWRDRVELRVAATTRSESGWHVMTCRSAPRSGGVRLRGTRARMATRSICSIRAAHLEAIRAARSGAASNFWRGRCERPTARRSPPGRPLTRPKVHSQYDYTCQGCRARGGQAARPSHPSGLARAGPSAGRRQPDQPSAMAVTSEYIATRETELAFMRRFADRVGLVEDIEVRTRAGFTAHRTSRAGRRDRVRRPAADLRPQHRRALAQLRRERDRRPQLVQRVQHEICEGDRRLLRPGSRRRALPGRQAGRLHASSRSTPELAEETRDELEAVYEQAYAAYTRLVEAGRRPRAGPGGHARRAPTPSSTGRSTPGR